jgi:hypothetical protein
MSAFYLASVDKTVDNPAGKTLTKEKFAGKSLPGNGEESNPKCPIPR